jgi:hypothetical protein
VNGLEVRAEGHHAGVLWICCCSSLMSNRRLNTNISFGRLLIVGDIKIRREVGEADELF